jgi:hypothetical protein
VQEQILPQAQASLLMPLENLQETVYAQINRQNDRMNSAEKAQKMMRSEQQQIMEELSKY